jgi:hypothetical protein
MVEKNTSLVIAYYHGCQKPHEVFDTHEVFDHLSYSFLIFLNISIHILKTMT